MSALGDYIHLSYRGYKKYGASRSTLQSSAPNYSVEVINNRIQNQLRSQNNGKDIDDKTIALLEARLKSNTDDKIMTEIAEWTQVKPQFIRVIHELLQKRCNAIKGAARITRVSQGNAYATLKEGGDVVTPVEGKANLFQFPNSQQWTTSESQQSLSKKHMEAKKLYKEIQILIDKINATGNNVNDFLKLCALFQQYSNLTIDPNKSTVASIQNALKAIHYKGAVTEISGAFGEMIVALGDNVVDSLAESEIADHIYRVVKGHESSDILIPKKAISTGYFLNKTSSQDSNKYYIATTKNKVDVEIDIAEDKVFASVKAGSPATSKPRPDLQDVSLFATLAFLNSYPGLQDFGNHWLNIHTSHTHQGYPSTPDLSNPSWDLIVKKEVAYQALSSGNPFKQGVNSANVFVYIHRATGKVYVRSVQKLLDEIGENNNGRIGGLNAISKVHLNKNIRQAEIWQRIQDVLRQLHQVKIQVALNIDFLS